MNKMSTQECQDSKSQLVYFMNNNFMYDSVLRKIELLVFLYEAHLLSVLLCTRNFPKK